MRLFLGAPGVSTPVCELVDAIAILHVETGPFWTVSVLAHSLHL